MKKIFWLVAGIILLISCKKEFTEIGFETLKDPNYRFETYVVQNIKTYSESVSRVYAQNQPVLNLGVYEHPAFGLNTADLTLRFGAGRNTFDSDHFLHADSILFVEIRIPFFSKKNEDLSTDTDPVYDVDSIFGTTPIKLSVYYNDYYFFPYDPSNDFLTSRMYYSDFDFDSYKQDLLFQDNAFTPDLSYVVDTIPMAGGIDLPEDVNASETKKDTMPPQLIIPLDTTFFRQKIFDHRGESVLTDPDLFVNHFRGVFIKTEPVGSGGTLMMMPNRAQLVIAYRYETTNDNGTPDDTSDDYTEKKFEKIVLFRDISVNTYHNLFYPSVDNKINNPDVTQGEDKIYIKGHAGSMGVIQLFSPQELYDLRNNDWLINQANIRFYVDETEMNTLSEDEQPKQLFLFKYPKNSIEDLSTTLENGLTVEAKNILAVYDGHLREDTLTHQHYYDFNITRYIKNVLRKDSTNVKLGLRVVPSMEGFIANTNPLSDPDAFIPFGTVLEGNRSGNKPVELKIYYTKPKED